MLRLEGLTTGYAGGTVLHGIDLHVPTGTVQAVIGRNGAGKTTLVHAVAGLLRPHAGRVLLDGADLTGAPAHRRARAGVALVPQGRRIFGSLTVAEHLAIAARGTGPWDPRRVRELLPQLAARSRHRARHLSGGEQQMLAIARALLLQPRVLLLDEPTEGLSPRLAARIHELIGELAGDGLTLLLTAPAPPPCQVDHTTALTHGRLTDRAPPTVPGERTATKKD